MENLKCQKVSGIIRTPEHGALSDSARGERVKPILMFILNQAEQLYECHVLKA